MGADHNGRRGVLGGSTRAAVIRRLGLALAIAVTMVSMAPSSAEAGWFKRITNFNGAKRFVSRVTNPNGAQRFVSRATNTHGIEHFWKTNKAGFERWARRLCPAQEEKQTESGYRPRSYRCQVEVHFGGGSGQ